MYPPEAILSKLSLGQEAGKEDQEPWPRVCTCELSAQSPDLHVDGEIGWINEEA